MKKIVTIYFALCITCFCYAQRYWKAASDSLALESRVKADIVLSKFDTISGKKILYSLLNKNYYIIIQSDNHYKEYVLSIDSICNVVAIKEVGNDKEIEELKLKKFLSKSQRELLKRLKEEKQIIREAFNTNQYSTELITSWSNATYVAGVPSYFVMKDENNTRYGEYSFIVYNSTLPN